MAGTVTLKPGVIVLLHELQPSSPLCTPSQSLRVLGLLESYEVETGMAVITDAGSSLKVDTQHLRDLPLRKGSRYQFIGELNFLANKARVGRNVDGIDMKLYSEALQLRRQFENTHLHA